MVVSVFNGIENGPWEIFTLEAFGVREADRRRGRQKQGVIGRRERRNNRKQEASVERLSSCRIPGSGLAGFKKGT